MSVANFKLHLLKHNQQKAKFIFLFCCIYYTTSKYYKSRKAILGECHNNFNMKSICDDTIMELIEAQKHKPISQQQLPQNFLFIYFLVCNLNGAKDQRMVFKTITCLNRHVLVGNNIVGMAFNVFTPNVVHSTLKPIFHSFCIILYIYLYIYLYFL